MSAEVGDGDIAIVGMAGRFPGADDPDQLWARVARGEDCLTDLDPDDLIRAGMPSATVRDPAYVKRAGVLSDVAGFDAHLFGIGARDAAVMDPQHRHFLECAWEALESAAHVPERFAGAIGVFAGCGMNTYLLNNLITNPGLIDDLGWFLLRHTGNDKDFLPTFVSYKLDLRGPSISVQTACSTSLVAIHLAVQSLLAFECDLALAGGATIDVPHGVGYQFREGEILSPDGRCRAFDARSGGTVLASGAGAVALRRLSDALEDGDPILAVIKGSAVNNDGSRKVGYLAPSVDGHADVVKEALAVAGLSARDIGLLEAHGTGTAVGDPIEVAALTEAFRASTTDTGFCRLVSTKPNIGHLDTAAGVASVMKAVQALQHRTLPPLANFTAPNPLLDLARSPFTLSGEASPWHSDAPRRAGVSSLGVGGTNAHVVLEEAPARPHTAPAVPEQVLCLSALSETALDAASTRLAAALEADPTINLADAAHTLFTGRRAMEQRRVVVVSGIADAPEVLRNNGSRRAFDATAGDAPPSLIFMFPGGGAQYPGMGSGLDARFDVYHRVLADGIDIVRRLGGPDLAPLLAPDGDDDTLRQAEASLPAVFVVSVALARQWMAWGAVPDALAGHSLGEYVAAHLAGVLSFDDAISLVVTRSRLMQRETSKGAMLVVSLPEADVRAALPDDLSLAVVNAADECVVAGAADAVARFASRLDADEVTHRLVPLAAAAHSALLEPVLDDFREAVRSVRLAPPTLRYLSNLTGTWITSEQATNPDYWVDHLRNTVRFDECLQTALADGPAVLVELGPGHALSSYARRQAAPPLGVVPALRHVNDTTPDSAFTLLAFAKLWALGAQIDVGQLAGPGRRRLRLPTYPFQHERYWIEPGEHAGPGAPVRIRSIDSTGERRLRRFDDIDRWFWEQSWQPQPAKAAPRRAGSGDWLVVADPDDALAHALVAELQEAGVTAALSTTVDASALEHVSCVAFVGPADPNLHGLAGSSERWLTAGLDVVRQLGAAPGPTRFAAITTRAMAVDAAADRPVDALALGPVLVAPKEYPTLRATLIDVDRETEGDAASIVAELLDGDDQLVAFRQGVRHVAGLRATTLAIADEVPIRPGETYVVTGGLGEIGSVLAGHLASAYRANLILVSSAPLPEPAEWDAWTAAHGLDDPTSRRLRRLQQLAGHGTKIAVVVADLTDAAAIAAALDEGERLVGPIDGVLHAAGALHDSLIALSDAHDYDRVLGPKANAAGALLAALTMRGKGRLYLVGSTSTVLGAEGQVAYVAANAYLDALAGQRGAIRVAAIDFGAWAGRGMAAEAAATARLRLRAGEPMRHPVLSSIHRESDGSVTAIGRLAADWHWLIDEHRTSAGEAVLPGTGHLELMIATLAEAGLPTALTDVALLQPVLVDDGRPVRVKVTASAVTADGTRTVQLETDGGHGKAWQVHSEARTAAAAPAPPQLAPDVLAPSSDAAPIDPLAEQRTHLRLGDRWSGVDAAHVRESRATAIVSIPPDDVGLWRAHPAAVDLATAVALTLFEPDAGRLNVPVGYDAVIRHGDLPERMVAIASPADARPSGGHRADVLLADPDSGTVVLELRGLTLRPVDPAGFAQYDDSDDDLDAGDADPGAGVFVALAEGLGIRADDATTVFDRVVASGRSRVIVSSVDLEALRTATQPKPEEATPVGAAPAAVGVSGVITQIWRELLGIQDFSRDADFFELGGHSLIAIRVMSRIQRELGVKLPLSALFSAPTVNALTALAESSGAVAPDAGAEPAGGDTAERAVQRVAHRCLVPLREEGDRTPLTIVHGAGGNVLFLSSLLRAMDPGRPVYGMQAMGIDSHDLPDPTLDAMAQRYAAELRAHRPGPYLLGGYSGGGIVALELAHQLQQLGEEVRGVVLFDSVPPGKAEPTRLQRWRNVTRHAMHGLGPLRPYIGLNVRWWKHRLFRAEFERSDQSEFGFSDVGELGYVDLYHYFTATAEKHRLHSYDVDAILLKADTVWPTQPEDYFWRRYIRGELIVSTTPGNHHSMLLPENAPKLAARLQPLLDRVDRPRGVTG